MAWQNARPKIGSRGRRILEDDYDDEDDDGPLSDQAAEDEEDDEAEYDDEDDADGDGDADGDVEMESLDDDEGQEDDDDFDEDDEDAEGDADEDAEGDDDDDEEGDEDDEDADGDGEDDDIEVDADGEDVDAEGDDDEDEDEDEDDEDDADGEADSVATPATTKPGTPAAARSEVSIITPSRPDAAQRQRIQPVPGANESPLRLRGRQILEDDEDYDDDEDKADKEAAADDAAQLAPAKPIKHGKYSAEAYTERSNARRAAIRPASEVFQTSSYSIEPLAAAPHVAHVHAFATSADSTVLLTGGSDGFVRSYNLYKTMNGRQMLTQSVRHAYVEGVVRAGVMTHFWGNDEIPRKTNLALLHDELPVSPVHALACHRDGLWGMSGTESGNINLFTVRHACGKIHHVFRKHKAPVSALVLADKDRTMISGSWDRGVHQWDLDTGKVVRSYPGHAGQVSSLCFRPIQSGSRHKRRRTSQGKGSSESTGLLDDPDVRISIAVHTPKANPSAADGMDLDPVELGAASKPEVAEKEDQTADNDLASALNLNGDNATSEPPPPPAPPDAEMEEAKTTLPEASPEDAEADRSKANQSKANESIKDEDNDSLFGGSDEEAAGEGVLAPLSAPKADADGTEPGPNSSAQATDAAGLPDADGEADADGDADGEDDDDGDGDADADDDDQPLFAIAQRERAAGIGTPSMSTVGLPTGSALARTQSSASLIGGMGSPAMHGSGLLLPSNGAGQGSPGGALGLTPALPSSQVSQPSLSSSISDLAAPQPPPKPRTQTSHLPKPAFGPATAGRGFSDDVSTFSDDILLSTTLAGQVLLWDRRVKSVAGPVGIVSNGHANNLSSLGRSGPHSHLNGNHGSAASTGTGGPLQRTLSGLSGNWLGPTQLSLSSSSSGNPYEQGRGVRALTLPDKTPPWCAAACWSAHGDRIYVGRRNETVDEWDLRMLGGGGGDSGSGSGSAAGGSDKHNPRFVRSLRLPVGSGSVSALCSMPNGRHIVCGSYDNVRLWDTEATGPSMPFRIVAGHHGGFVSQMGVDATARFLLVASGDRGWLSTSTETLIIHEIQTSS